MLDAFGERLNLYWCIGPIHLVSPTHHIGPIKVMLSLTGWVQCINKGPIAECAHVHKMFGLITKYNNGSLSYTLDPLSNNESMWCVCIKLMHPINALLIKVLSLAECVQHLSVIKGQLKIQIMHKMLDLITNYYSDGPLHYTLGPLNNESIWCVGTRRMGPKH